MQQALPTRIGEAQGLTNWLTDKKTLVWFAGDSFISRSLRFEGYMRSKMQLFQETKYPLLANRERGLSLLNEVRLNEYKENSLESRLREMIKCCRTLLEQESDCWLIAVINENDSMTSWTLPKALFLKALKVLEITCNTINNKDIKRKKIKLLEIDVCTLYTLTWLLFLPQCLPATFCLYRKRTFFTLKESIFLHLGEKSTEDWTKD